MNITDITDDNTSICNCTDDEEMMIEISPLFLLIAILPCAFSIISVISISTRSFIKVLINKK